MVPQFLQPLSAWFIEAHGIKSGTQLRGVSLDWVPPMRMIADPAREYSGLSVAVRSGFMSRSGVVRQLGHDNEDVTAEIIADNALADENGLVFDTDPRRTTGAGNMQADTEAADPETSEESSDDPTE